MLEKRKHKRLKMEHALELARLNADGTADDGVVNADILNISRGGSDFCPARASRSAVIMTQGSACSAGR